MNRLSVPSPCSVVVCLDNGLVFTQEFEVDLVLRLVAFEGREVDVEIETASVALWALDFGTERAVEEASGGAPPRAAAVVEGYCDGVRFREVSADFGAVVDGDLFEGLGLVGWSLWVKCRVRHWRGAGGRERKRERESGRERLEMVRECIGQTGSDVD